MTKSIKKSKRELILMVTLLVIIGVSFLFYPPIKSTEASSPSSATEIYQTRDFRVWCESPSGDKVYVAKTNPGTGGASIVVVPGGCK